MRNNFARTFICAAGIAVALLSASVATTKADTIDVTYSVSGSAGDWLLNVSLANNGSDYVSLLSFFLPNAYFFSDVSDPLYAYGGERVDQNGVGLSYSNFGIPLIGAGQSLSFVYELFDPTAPSDIQWNAYLGSCCSDGLSGTVSAVPLPAALPLFASGLAGLGWLSRRRRKQAQASA